MTPRPFSGSLGNVLTGELEEARMLVDTAERSKRHIEGEVGDAREHISNLTNANNALSVDKRRLEGDIRGAQQELDNLVNQVKHAEEKARKAIADAGRLAEELRTEQEHGMAADKTLKVLVAQSQELQQRLVDVEATALRHGRKIIAKLEERVRSLEEELGKYLLKWDPSMTSKDVFHRCLENSTCKKSDSVSFQNFGVMKLRQ